MQTRSSPFCAIRELAVALTLLSSVLPAALASAEGGRVVIAQAGEGEETDSGETPPSQPSQPAPAPPPPGADVEEIVIVGAESDSSSDFSAGDSVTGFGAEDLAALGAQSIADLASFTPNLEIVTAGATTPTFFIRGVGLNDFNPNSTGAVAVYQDDVAINAPAIQLGPLFDVESVNVLRGPQGTGLNRNASAGAIKLYSRKPTGEFSGFVRSDFGNYDLQDYEGAFEAPIFEDLLAGRFAFRLSQRDGTMKNRCASAAPFGQRVQVPFTGQFPPGTSASTGPWSQCGEPVVRFRDPTFDGFSAVPPGLDEYVNDTNNWASRGTLLFQPTLDSSFLLNLHGSRRDELTRLGQSIGTSGNFCRDPSINCRGQNAFNASGGLLGGAQGAGRSHLNGYIPREIRQRLRELAPCLVAIDQQNEGCLTQGLGVELASNLARIKVANELARELDSEPWEGDFNHVGPTKNDTYGGYLKGDFALPRGLELKTTSAFDAYDRVVDTDLDFSPETLFQIRSEDEAWQVYQDLALAGDLGETGAFQWEIGGWVLREQLDVVVANDFGATASASVGVRARDYTQDTLSAAGYGYFSFDFWEDFTLDGGWRYNWENKELDMLIDGGENVQPPGCVRPGQGIPLECANEKTWNASTGTIRLLYRFRDDTHVSWRYTRGWKPGSFNATASQFTGPTVAEPEELDSFEFGLHGSWFEGRFGLDGSLFYYSYSDYQIFTAQQFLGGTPEFVLLNANDAEVYGSEIDATARPWDGAFWNVRFSWLESQFLDFLRRDQFLVASNTGSPVTFRDSQNSGNPLLNSPEFKVSITAEQGFRLGRHGSLTFRYDGVWTATTYYDATQGKGLGNEDGEQFLPDDTIGQVPYWLHNARVSWRSPDGRFEIAGWIRNIENKPYKTFAFDGSTFNATTIYFVGDPRTYGLSLLVSFF